MFLKGIHHKDRCFQCKKKFEHNERIINKLYLNDEDEIEKFTILCNKCHYATCDNNKVIFWRTTFKKPFSKREFVKGLSEYFFTTYHSISDEKARFIIAYLLYQQRILHMKERNEEKIIFESKEHKQIYTVNNFYGKISFKYVKTILKNLWNNINPTTSGKGER